MIMMILWTMTFQTRVMLTVTPQNYRYQSHKKTTQQSHGKTGFDVAHTKPKITSRNSVQKIGSACNDGENGGGHNELQQTTTNGHGRHCCGNQFSTDDFKHEGNKDDRANGGLTTSPTT